VRVLVVGGGGREHALCWCLARSAEVFCAPGNPGTAASATNLPISPDDPALLDAVRQHRIDLTVVGPEAPLAAGLADRLAAAGRAVFGPSAAAARIESSKAFAKALMQQAGVPTAAHRSFTDPAEALRYIDRHAEPLVVKASGLAAGKGAVVCATRGEAADAARAMFGGRFGAAGSEVVVEACLAGEELSVFALTDGEQVVLLPSAQDHKRLGEADTGPNTGGMGAYTPVSVATPALLDRVEREVLRPTLAGLARAGAAYRGVLYAGLMIQRDGSPAVIEFNCRFGDPEAQVVLPVGDHDLLADLASIASGEAWRPAARRVAARRAAVTTVLAAPGYPEAPRKGAVITLPPPPSTGDDAVLFHAGTARGPDGILRVAGGRVLCATGFGPDVATAAEASRRLADQVAFAGKVWRRDIAWREVARAGVA
jgi:phosphoribosylamine--glycine ligase